MPTIPLHFANELPSRGGINQDSSASIVRGLDRVGDALGTIGAQWQTEVNRRKKEIAAHDKAIEDARRESELIRRGEEMQTQGNEELARLTLENPGNSKAVADGMAVWSKNYQEASLRYVDDPLLQARLGGKLATVGGGLEVQGVTYHRNEAPKEIKLNAKMAMESSMQNSVATGITPATAVTMTPKQVFDAITKGVDTSLAAVNLATGPGFSPDEQQEFNTNFRDEWYAQHLAAYSIHASPEKVQQLAELLVPKFTNQKYAASVADKARNQVIQAQKAREAEEQRKQQERYQEARYFVSQGGKLPPEAMDDFTPSQRLGIASEERSYTARVEAQDKQSTAADNKLSAAMVNNAAVYGDEVRGFLTKTKMGTYRAPSTPEVRLTAAMNARAIMLRLSSFPGEMGETAEEGHLIKLLKNSNLAARATFGLAIGTIGTDFDKSLDRAHSVARINTIAVPEPYARSDVSRQRYRDAVRTGFNLYLASSMAGMVEKTKGEARPSDIKLYYFSPTQPVPASLARTAGFQDTRSADYRAALEAGKRYAAQFMSIQRPAVKRPGAE